MRLSLNVYDNDDEMVKLNQCETFNQWFWFAMCVCGSHHLIYASYVLSKQFRLKSLKLKDVKKGYIHVRNFSNNDCDDKYIVKGSLKMCSFTLIFQISTFFHHRISFPLERDGRKKRT